MKKKQIKTFTAVAVSLCFTGCGVNKPARNTTAELETQDIVYDSATQNNIVCKITAAYPKGDDSLSAGIRKFIAGELAALYLPHNDIDDDSQAAKFPFYKGSTDSGKQTVDFYGNGTMRYLEGLRQEWKSSSGAGNEFPALSQQITVALAETAAKYITYSVTGDSYLGGAHHSATSYSRNISRSTYKPVDNIINGNKLKALQPLLRKSILRCVIASGVDSATDSTLNNYIILPDDGLVPLPVHSPWIEKDSVKFIYQQYEIASYAMGAISFSVAAKDIMPYLTGEAKALLSDD